MVEVGCDERKNDKLIALQADAAITQEMGSFLTNPA